MMTSGGKSYGYKTTSFTKTVSVDYPQQWAGSTDTVLSVKGSGILLGVNKIINYKKTGANPSTPPSCYIQIIIDGVVINTENYIQTVENWSDGPAYGYIDHSYNNGEYTTTPIIGTLQKMLPYKSYTSGGITEYNKMSPALQYAFQTSVNNANYPIPDVNIPFKKSLEIISHMNTGAIWNTTGQSKRLTQDINVFYAN